MVFNRVFVKVVLFATIAMNCCMLNAKDQYFGGAELGLGGIGSFGVGAMAGYQHYFPKQYYIADRFRQGVRGIAEVKYSSINYSYWGGSYSYGGLFVEGAADYLLDFNPEDKNVWGLFAGLGLGYISYSSSEWYVNTQTMLFDVRLGGSYTMNNTHRFEVALGSGFSTLGLRYFLLF